jgi:hypothetical protein
MNKYRIDNKPAEYYLDQFKPENIEVLPYREAGFYLLKKGKLEQADDSRKGRAYHFSEQLPQGVATILYGFDDLDFDINFPVKDGKVDTLFINLAKEILAQLPALDSRAREVPTDFDHEEHLAYIDVSESEIELHYFASTVNTEWGAYFKRMTDGSWNFEGLG